VLSPPLPVAYAWLAHDLLTEYMQLLSLVRRARLPVDVQHLPFIWCDEDRSSTAGCSAQVVPTPLTRLRWWRVCLDEAQMVESSTAKAAEMALKLDAQHRWAVTGTPLSRGLEDLFGLMVCT